ncbi:MAG: CoA transferase subunit A [Prevotellaceae bacterium]|nr:CoA transferase subunit A [Prevotellaceae bacterium]
MEKFISANEAAAFAKDGMTIMIGGFLGNGAPEKIIDALVASGVKDLTVICNDTGFTNIGVGKLFDNHQVKKAIVSYSGGNPASIEQLNAGTLNIEYVPQGTLAERVRAGGCGLGGVLTPTGLGTLAAQEKQIISVDGRDFLLEKPLRADVAFIRASTGDKAGNLLYRGASQNFNPLMAMAANIVVAEVAQLLETGDIPPENVRTQSIFVNYMVTN